MSTRWRRWFVVAVLATLAQGCPLAMPESTPDGDAGGSELDLPEQTADDGALDEGGGDADGPGPPDAAPDGVAEGGYRLERGGFGLTASTTGDGRWRLEGGVGWVAVTATGGGWSMSGGVR